MVDLLEEPVGEVELDTEPMVKSPVYEFKGDPAQEIAGKVKRWETALSSTLSKFDQYDNFFRQIRAPVKDKREGFSDAMTGETTRATRTLATMMYRMMTSADPNFYFVSLDSSVTHQQLNDAEDIQLMQRQWLQKNRYLLKACYTMALFGSVPVEEPWVVYKVGGVPRWEGTGFYPRSLSQVAFDHSVPEVEMSDWHAIIDFVSPDRLRRLALDNPDTYSLTVVEEAIEASGDRRKIPEVVRRRRAAAGYTDDGGPVMQLVTYYGNLKDNVNPEGRDWVVGTVNDIYTVRGHTLAQTSNIRPVRFGQYVEHELEPYGYGVGQFGGQLQSDLDSNRRRMVNIAVFNLYHMWKMSRLAGVKPAQLRVRPWGAVELDDMAGLEPLRPDLNAFNVGKMLEEMLKDDFRANTGATANLQAIVTEATASEASIAQNEAVRNISVQTEIAAEQLIRWHLIVSHENNLQFLDRPFWLNRDTKTEPRKVYPGDLPHNIEPYIRIVTDKDFRPERVRRMIEALQTITSVRNQLPPDVQVQILPLVEEIMHALNVPNVIQPKTAMDKIADNVTMAQKMAAEAAGGAPPGGDEAAAAGNGVGGSPMDIPGGTGVLNTPVGPVLASRQ